MRECGGYGISRTLMFSFGRAHPCCPRASCARGPRCITGDSLCARAADEVAVQAFLDGKIGYTGIHRLVEQVLTEHESLPGDNAAEVLSADEWASARSKELVAA